MAHKTLLCLLFFVANYLDCSFGSMLCDEGFCRNYENTIGCDSTHIHCSINNETHSGLSLPSPTECNCCDFCLPFYLEGEHCSLGGTGTGTGIGRCGDGLWCQQEADGNFCRRMDTVCHRAQDDFDERHANGLTGAMEQRPLCDGKGRFEAYDCVPTQTCFCQNEEGERIFGEFPFLGSVSLQRKHCGCSVRYYEIHESLGDATSYIPTPRCTPDGSFNPVQCIGKTCYCVDIETGDIHIRDTINLDTKPISDLPCYDAQFDVWPSLNGDKNFTYTTPCLQSIADRVKLLQESKDLGYNVDYYAGLPECLPDGSFGRMAAFNGMQVCVDHRNRRIGTYEATPGTEEFDNMDCKCALTTSMMSSNELPICCKNGNFRPMQCRRGICRCVDSDGKQVGQETSDMTSLPCYNPNGIIC